MTKLFTLIAALLLSVNSAVAQLYWVTATTAPEYGQEEGGVNNFALKVEIDGSTATISGWKNYVLAVGSTPTNTIDDKAVGTYDAASRRITIQTPFYDYNNQDADYCFVASFESWGEENRLMLESADDVENDYDLTKHDSLTFVVSEDGSTITCEEQPALATVYYYDGYGWFNSQTQYFTSFTMNKMADGADLQVSPASIDFTSTYLTPGKTVNGSFKITNMGQQDGHYVLTTDNSQLTVTSATDSTLTGGGNANVNFQFAPTEANPDFTGHIFVTDDKGNKDTVSVKAVVAAAQDYSKVIDRGELNFTAGDDMPFVIDETTYGKPVLASTATASKTSTVFINFTVPENKIATLSWAGQSKGEKANISMRSNDYNEDYGYIWALNQSTENTDAVTDLSGSYLFKSGTYNMRLTVNALDVAENGYVYFSNFALDVEDEKENAALLKTPEVVFDSAYYSQENVVLTATAELVNKGTSLLSVTGIDSDNAEFGGVVPTGSTTQLNTLPVTLTFNGKGQGEHKGNVTLHTTAGDFVVAAKVWLDSLTTDFSPIVKSGDFIFTTSHDHPFLVNTTASEPYAYNSTAGKPAKGNKESWLDASFNVPEGITATLAWTGHNSSADKEYSWFGGYYLVDGTIITIDGGLSQEVGGDNDASSTIYDAENLKFGAGHHVVRFLYEKTGEKPVGDDQLQLRDLALTFTSNKADSASINAAGVHFAPATLMRKSWATVYLRNLGNNPLKVTDVKSSDPDIMGGLVPAKEAATLDSIPVQVFFAPKEETAYQGTITIETTAGNFALTCDGEGQPLYYNGQAIDCTKATALFSDGFEAQLDSSWTLQADEEGNTFRLSSDDVFYSFEDGGYVHFKYHDAEAMGHYQGNGALVTREIEIPDDGQTFLDYYSFASQKDGYLLYGPDLEYGISDYDTLYVDSCDPGYIYRPQRGTRWGQHTIDLTPLAGQTVRLAWTCGHGEFYILDDVLVYHYDGILDNIRDTRAANKHGEPVATEYYGLDGARRDALQRGINLVKYHYADGTVETRKVVRK